MILLLTGATHTGKTALAQHLLERYHYPYLSLDLLKMGLIRSGQTALTPEDEEERIPRRLSDGSPLSAVCLSVSRPGRLQTRLRGQTGKAPVPARAGLTDDGGAEERAVF